MKTYVLFLTIIMMAVSFSVRAQHSLSGRVFDMDDQTTLPGAHVVVEGTHSGAFAGQQGYFQISQIAAGQYSLRVSFLGYTTRTIAIDVPLTEKLEIGLVRNATLTEEVIVSANRATGRIGATFTDLSKEDLLPSNLGQDLPMLISLTPSVIVSSDAGAGVGYTWMNIRGSDQSRINVTFNGIPLNDAESHGVWWVNMPDLVSSIESLQIQRGAGLSTQGSGAFGATINMQTNTLREKTYAELSSSTGSFNTMKHSVGFGTGLIHNHWTFDGRISRISSDGYIDRARSDLGSFYLSGGYYGSRTMVKGLVFSGNETTYQAWNGVPGDSLRTNRQFNPSGMFFDDQGQLQYYDNETDNYQQDHYQLHLSHAFIPELNANLSLHYTYGRGYYEQYRQNERFSRYNLPNVIIGEETISRSDLIRRRWLDNHFYGFTYSLNYNSFGSTTATLGGGLHLYDGDHFGEIIWARYAQHANIRHRYYDNNGFKRDFSSFIKLTQTFSPRLNGFVDLQYRTVSYDFLGLAWVNQELQPLEQQVVYHFFNPKAGVSFDINPSHNIYLYAGLANREPVRRDFTESSPESRPKPEHMQNIEVGYRYAANRTMLSVNAYLMNYRDQLVLTGEINDVGGYTRTNTDRSHRAGIELETAYIFGPMLQWRGNLTLSRNKIARIEEHYDLYDNNWNWTGTASKVYENTDIAFSPSLIGAGMLQFNPWPELGISLNTKYVGARYIDNTMSSDRMLDPYLVNDLRLNYTIKTRLFSELELKFMANNLFDVMYETNAWIYKGIVGDNGLMTIEDGYFPQAGRHFLGGVVVRL